MKPILFNTAMVQAILSGQKTTTRRIIKVDSKLKFFGYSRDKLALFGNGCCIHKQIKVPYIPGDILYVREKWKTSEKGYIYYENMIKENVIYTDVDDDPIKWKPSIHMPKEAARIFLSVKYVRVERLHDIDYEGCKSEGVKAGYDGWLGEWKGLWDSTVNKKYIDMYGWNANPYVFVIEFEICDKGEI